MFTTENEIIRRSWRQMYSLLDLLQIFFSSSPWNSVKVSWVARMGRNFDDYPGFQLFLTQVKHFCPECIFPIFFLSRNLDQWFKYWKYISRYLFRHKITWNWLVLWSYLPSPPISALSTTSLNNLNPDNFHVKIHSTN